MPVTACRSLLGVTGDGCGHLKSETESNCGKAAGSHGYRWQEVEFSSGSWLSLGQFYLLSKGDAKVMPIPLYSILLRRTKNSADEGSKTISDCVAAFRYQRGRAYCPLLQGRKAWDPHTGLASDFVYRLSESRRT